MPRNKFEIHIVGPSTGIPLLSSFIVYVKNIVVPEISALSLPSFTVGLLNSNGEVLESKSSVLLAELPSTSVSSSVLISSVTPSNDLLSKLVDYEIKFQIIGSEEEKVQEIVLDFSSKYFPYTLKTYSPTVTLS